MGRIPHAEIERGPGGRWCRVQKVLEGANVKLSSVVTDVLGVSGRAMFEAIVAGTEGPEVIANMAKGRLRTSGLLSKRRFADLSGLTNG